MKEIIIIGAGGHARVVVDVIRLAGLYHVHGFIDGVKPDRHGTEFEGSPILGGEPHLAEVLQAGVVHAALGVGDNAARTRIAHHLRHLGFELPALTHPRAIIASSASLGSGTVAFAGAIVNPATRIGANVILNTGSIIDHDCIIGDGVHIAPGVSIAGHVTIGDGTLVGVGACIRPGITIGHHAVVGAGAAVVRDVPDGATVAGVPARIVK